MALASHSSLPPPSQPPPLKPRPRTQPKISIPTPSSARIPTWVSLNRCSPPPTRLDDPARRGLAENLHLASLARQGRLEEARDFLRRMEASGIFIRISSYEQLLDACGRWKSPQHGAFFHDSLRRALGREPDGPLGMRLLVMYLDCSCLDRVRKVFDGMPVRSVIAWRTLAVGYARSGLIAEAADVVSAMLSAGIVPDHALLISLRLSERHAVGLGRQAHSHLVKTGAAAAASVATNLLKMYVSLGCLESSIRVFRRLEEPDAVSLTEIMVAYVGEERAGDALDLFVEMMRAGVALDPFVFSIALKACSEVEDLPSGRQVHGLVVKLGEDADVFTGTPLVDLYAKCGLMGHAELAFDRIACPNDFSWSALISGYSQMGKFEECIQTFKHLRNGRPDAMNHCQYTGVLQACTALADSSSGGQVHADAIKRGLLSELYGETALVAMYSRSGDLGSARHAFNSIEEPDTVSWTAMICGCAYHGRASEALGHFSRMRRSGVKPNALTFSGVLTACSHSGLVSEARKYLDSMEAVYGVRPTTEHFNCVVDACCRANRLEEALGFIRGGSFEPNAMTWKVLLSGCVSHSDVELGRMAGERLLELEAEDSAAYVLLFNLYASSGRWKDAVSVRRLMNERRILKEVGCSWMMVRGEVHRFIAGDKHHPQTAEIYAKLEELGQATPSKLDKQKHHQLLDHSERLAVAFGLVSTPGGSPIAIFKNLRICRDCHSFFKSVSKTTAREIIVRDTSRFHLFKDGFCSCKDYW